MELTNRFENIRTKWTEQEDKLLKKAVKKYGTRWSKIAMSLPGRIGKQCRERWANHLNPEVSKKEWSREEDLIILSLFKKFGPDWMRIAAHMDKRTNMQVKNRYYHFIKKRESQLAPLLPKIEFIGPAKSLLKKNKPKKQEFEVPALKNLPAKIKSTEADLIEYKEAVKIKPKTQVYQIVIKTHSSGPSEQ